MTVHGEDYNLQVSSWGSIVGIVGDKCGLPCIVPKKLKTPVDSSLDPVEYSFKDMKADDMLVTGFRQDSF